MDFSTNFLLKAQPKPGGIFFGLLLPCSNSLSVVSLFALSSKQPLVSVPGEDRLASFAAPPRLLCHRQLESWNKMMLLWLGKLRFSSSCSSSSWFRARWWYLLYLPSVVGVLYMVYFYFVLPQIDVITFSGRMTCNLKFKQCELPSLWYCLNLNYLELIIMAFVLSLSRFIS